MGRLGAVVHTDDGAPMVLAPLANRSTILDRNGTEMAVLYGDEDREDVPLSSVPEPVKRSVIGIEDREFYSHKGVSARAIGRALSTNLGSGELDQGGSTITQQLVKMAIVGPQKTLERKVKEAVLALRLEGQMTKDEILERYLNAVYLGNGAYGMQAAAETYFDTSVESLGWPEAALLTALIRSPNGYDPIKRPKLAAARRDLVAKRLRREGVIDDATLAEIRDAPLPTRIHKRSATTASVQLAGANYFSEAVKQQLLDLPELGSTPEARYNKVFRGGLRVATTYDPVAQGQAEAAVATLPNTGGKFQAALAAIDPSTGAVRAVVGGTDFAKQKLNLATQGWRQPGSSFKFFSLMAAFDEGLVPGDTISGASPCSFEDPTAPGGVYTAENSGGSGGKVASIERQTLSSSNCAFLRLGQAIGLDRLAAMADALGITTLNDNFVEGPVPDDVLSLPIGSKEVHPIKMAAAYAAAADDGRYHKEFFIESVTDATGEVIYRHRDPGTAVVSPQTARLVTSVLAANVTSGTGRNARLPDQVAAGKTGTTQDNADVWFVGYTPYLVTAVWIGSPTGRDKVVLKGKAQFGADFPSRIWKTFMEAYHRDLQPREFPEPGPTRKATSVKYANKADKSGSCKTTSRGGSGSASTTTVLGRCPGTSPKKPRSTTTSSSSVPSTTPPPVPTTTRVPVTAPPTTAKPTPTVTVAGSEP